METKIQKWGNSLAVRLPKDITKKLELREGSVVVVSEDRKRIVLRHIPKKKVALAELIKQITPKNLHDEIEWSTSRGKETW
jgi:antitoxin MazE